MTAADHLERAREQERHLAAQRDVRARALAWSRTAFPERVEGSHACPFAAHFALEDMRRTGLDKPRKGIVAARLAAHDERHAA